MAAAVTGLSALVLGATGATGKHLLREILSSERFSRVVEYGRSVTPLSKLPDSVKSKLEQRTVDFENLDVPMFKQGNWDVVFIALGVNRSKTDSAEAFEKIDREYVLRAARAAKSGDPNRKQRLVYISATSANMNSMRLYSRSKALTEQGLAASGYDDVIFFRPGLLMNAERQERRIGQNIAEPVVGFLNMLGGSYGIPVDTLGKSIRLAGELGSDNIPSDMKSTTAHGGPSFTIIDNAQALKLASLQ